jgi:hypothetical protein
MNTRRKLPIWLVKWIAKSAMSRYTYRAGAELGEISAVDFADARRRLDEMISPAIVAGGGWGWVEDKDGERYYIARENM